MSITSLELRSEITPAGQLRLSLEEIFHFNGHANTNEDLVRTARARLAELAAKPAPNG